jgi:segregation and condensation protein A
MSEEKQMTDKWTVNLDVFEGPLDLLLHLINKLEIDIYDIPIAKITAQYMDYLQAMQLLQLDVAGDYLVMAATLMNIKSQMLVPRNDGFDEEEGEDFYPEDEDPREQLMEMLLEYRKFKNVASQLEEKQEERSVYFTKDPSDVSHLQDKIPLRENEIDLHDLMTVFKDMLRRKELRDPTPTTIETEEITVTEKMNFIEQRLRNNKHGRVSFRKLFDVPSKREMVVTFLALLELIKENKIVAKQEETYSDIELAFLG